MAATTLFDIARVNTGTIGTGTITLGSAVQSFLTFAGAGVTDQTVVRYLIEDPPNREVGFGTYTASGTTLTRNVVLSTNSNNPISLSGVAQVALTALAEDITNKNGDTLQGALNWATAPTVSSASTTTIGAQTSNYIIISGTTTITAFDTIAQGAMRWLRFSGALTLTNNSTSLICIGNASITTAAGDIAQMVSEGSGNWRMLAYTKASGAGAAISPTVDIRTASATITIPSGASKLKVSLVGGGGGSGGSVAAVSCPCITTAAKGGAPGGPGGVVVKYLSGLTAGNTLALTIGSGGSAGTASGSGGAGGNSSLASGSQSITTLTASGGAGGGSNSGAGGAPGTGTNGDLNISGGEGTADANGSRSGTTGLGLGPGRAIFAVSITAALAGIGYGGAACGGYATSSSQAGAAGAAGAAIFEWYA